MSAHIATICGPLQVQWQNQKSEREITLPNTPSATSASLRYLCLFDTHRSCGRSNNEFLRVHRLEMEYRVHQHVLPNMRVVLANLIGNFLLIPIKLRACRRNFILQLRIQIFAHLRILLLYHFEKHLRIRVTACNEVGIYLLISSACMSVTWAISLNLFHMLS